MDRNGRHNPLVALLYVLIATMPFWYTVLLARIEFQASVSDFHVTYDDEIDYWHQILTFSKYGFDGGRYTFDEATPAIDFFHFGAHGPAVPVFYGTLARLTGWQVNTPPYFNMAVVFLSLLIYLLIVRPGVWESSLILAALLLFMPVATELLSSMQEPIQFGIAILLAALLFSYHRGRRYALAGELVLVAAILLATLFRPLWLVLLLPYWGITVARRGPGRSLLTVVLTALLGVFAAGFYFRSAAPYDNFMSRLVARLGTSLPEGLDMLGSHIRGGLNGLAEQPVLAIYGSAQALLFGIAIGTAIASLVWYGRARRRGAPVPQAVPAVELTVIVVLALVFAFNLATYYASNWQGGRMFAPFVLFVMFFTIAYGRRVYLLITVIALMIMLPGSWPEFTAMRAPNFTPIAEGSFADFTRAVQKNLVFAADADPWCNTILVDKESYCRKPGDCVHITVIPAGFGVSWVFHDDFKPSVIHSRYLLLSKQRYLAWQKSHRLRDSALLAKTKIGYLVQNKSVACNQVSN